MSDDRKQFSTPDEARSKALRRKIRTWGGLAVGTAALVWGAVDGGVTYYVVALVCYGIVEPSEALRVIRR